MTDTEEVGCTAARLVMRHGGNAPRFAETLAREMDRAGRARESRHWQAVARLAGAILTGMTFGSWSTADSTALPSGPYDRRLGAN
jgi:hypothetical protein